MPKLDYLTEEDHKVLNAIESRYGYSNYYDGDLYFDDVRGPLALVGHPRVFDAAAPERQIEVISYPVELVVREDGERIRIDLSHRADEPQVFVEMETPTRWRVIELTPALVELAAILGSEGLAAPREARERIVALVQAETPRLPVRSELAGMASQVAEGDARPVLQIAPEAGGFTIRAMVRPLGDDGPAYVPGLGSQSVLVPAAGGAHRRVHRDLGAETSALEAVAAACPALAPWRDTDTVWRIGTLDAALEALQQLHACDGPLRLEWPEGAAIQSDPQRRRQRHFAEHRLRT